MGRLKIVYPICCGMDVHRDFVIACIATTNVQGVTEYQSRRFSTYTEELRELKAWLDDNNCKDVCFCHHYLFLTATQTVFSLCSSLKS